MELPIVSICLLLACLTPASLQQDDCQNKDSRCPNMPKHGREVFCQRPWARRNCQQLCGICGDQPLVVKVSCYDINNRCADMPHDYDVFCARPWAKRNCKKFCHVCASDTNTTTEVSTTTTPTTTTTTSTTTTTTPTPTTTTPTTTTTTPTTTTTTPTTTTTTPTTTTTTPTTTTTTLTTTTTTPTTTTTTPTTTTAAPLTRSSLCKDKNDGVRFINRFPVICDGGWLIIQRRSSFMDFYRRYTDYQKGFGNFGINFWLGLDKLHWLCGTKPCQLRIDMKFDGTPSKGVNKRPDGSYFALYQEFTVGDSDSGYKLGLSGYSGNANDMMSYDNGSKFSTRDNDQDQDISLNWAKATQGAWWYGKGKANLNGKWGSEKTWQGVTWHDLTGSERSLSFTEMKIRQQ